MIKENNLKKLPISSLPEELPFFSTYSVESLLNQLREKRYNTAIERNNLILELIKLKEPISKYALAKLTNLSYPTIKLVCKWFEASDLIKVRLATGENGMPVKLIYTREVEE